MNTGTPPAPRRSTMADATERALISPPIVGSGTPIDFFNTRGARKPARGKKKDLLGPQDNANG